MALAARAGAAVDDPILRTHVIARGRVAPLAIIGACGYRVMRAWLTAAGPRGYEASHESGLLLQEKELVSMRFICRVIPGVPSAFP
jgi:hypothetical protein